MQTVEIVKALRCIAAPDAEERHCENCPFCVKEVLDAEYTAIFGGGEVDACDCDAVGNLAADRLEELLDRCARYAEEIAVLRERQRWIPVTERLPEDPVKKCIVFVPHTPGNIVDLGRYLGSGGWVLGGWYLTQAAVTHWMPLPPAPEVEHGQA